MNEQTMLLDAYGEALQVWEGACNPVAIAGVLHRVYFAEHNLGGTDRAAKSPAARLILDQLIHLSGPEATDVFTAADQVRQALKEAGR